MEKSRATADRVRPILQAMERSIEMARRRRLHGSQPQAPAQPPVPSQAQPPVPPQAQPTFQPQFRPPHQAHRDHGQAQAQPRPVSSIPREGGPPGSDLYDDETVPRRKARPKRPSPMLPSYDDPDYRAQAG